MATTLPKLLYFAFRGRGLAARVSLFNALGKEGWIDERVSLPRYKKVVKPESDMNRVHGEYVTNNLPQLNLPCGLKLTQSHAIARYAAKLGDASTRPSHYCTDLYPTNPRDAALVDEAIAIVDQILLLTPKDIDPVLKEKNRVLYQKSGFLRVGMEVLEGRIAQSGGPYILGSKLSIADLYIRAPLCDLFELGQFEGVTKEFVDEFPLIKACGDAVMEHELLKAYKEAGFKS